MREKVYGMLDGCSAKSDASLAMTECHECLGSHVVEDQWASAAVVVGAARTFMNAWKVSMSMMLQALCMLCPLLRWGAGSMASFAA